MIPVSALQSRFSISGPPRPPAITGHVPAWPHRSSFQEDPHHEEQD